MLPNDTPERSPLVRATEILKNILPLWVDVWIARKTFPTAYPDAKPLEAVEDTTTSLPRPTKTILTYHYPDMPPLEPPRMGQCVWVPLGAKNQVLGVIVGIRNPDTSEPLAFVPRAIQKVLTHYRIYDEAYQRYLSWVASYYGVGLDTCLAMALPSSLLVSPPVVKYQRTALIDKALLLKKGSHQKRVYEVLPPLEQGASKSILQIQAILRQQAQAQEVKTPSLSKLQIKHALQALAQKGLVLEAVSESIASPPNALGFKSSRSRPAAHASNVSDLTNHPPSLTQAQEEVLEALRLQEQHQKQTGRVIPQLLHGVTGSGKTEIYLQRILDILTTHLEAQASSPTPVVAPQILILVPEIVLTTQLLARFEARIGKGCVKPWHSQLTDTQRQTTWYGVLHGKVTCVLGARSSVWLPFQSLKLIVVDECHETSFRQETFSPRYDARTLAMYLAHTHQAQLILGSATPSMAQLYEALDTQNWGYHRLSERPTAQALPKVHFIDKLANPNEAFLDPPSSISSDAESTTEAPVSLMQPSLEAPPSKPIWQDALSRTLVKRLRQTLQQGQQAILLLNRRGYHKVLFCENCRTTLQCPQCSVSLTLHAFKDQHTTRYVAVCHQCDYRLPQPTPCPVCDTPKLKPFGGGSQKLEETLQTFVPEILLARLDRDTTQRKAAVSEALQKMQAGTLNTLIGTQMIAKGLDLPEVTLVGVLEADSTLWMPDFQVNERVFQLITQVAGRAGRGKQAGEVYIETVQPQHPVLQFAKHQDTLGFYAWEKTEHRQPLGYPPFSQLARWVFSCPDAHKLEALQQQLRPLVGAFERLPMPLGPVACPIAKLQNRWRCHWVWKLPPAPATLPECLTPTPAHQALIQCTHDLQRHFQTYLMTHGIRWILEIDPLTLK